MNFYITILPPERYMNWMTQYNISNTKFKFNGFNSTVRSNISFKRSSGNVLPETIFEVTSTGEELADTVTLDFDIVSNMKFFNVFDVTPAQVNISSLQ